MTDEEEDNPLPFSLDDQEFEELDPEEKVVYIGFAIDQLEVQMNKLTGMKKQIKIYLNDFEVTKSRLEDLKKEQVKNTRFNHNGDLTEIKKEISEIIDNIGEDFPGTDFGSTDDEDEEYDVESLVEPLVDDLEGDKLSDESE